MGLYKLLGIFLLIFLSSCGRLNNNPASLPSAQASCSPNEALILVGDGFMEILCGCNGINEAQGTIASHLTDLTCHLSSNTHRVSFYFGGSVLPHQVVSTGDLLFPASPVSDPLRLSDFYIYTVELSKPSSIYLFQDQFNGIKGQLITY